MKAKPIIFSGEMVRAILDGRKSQTRRVAKRTSGGHLKEPNGHRRWHPDDPDAVLACPYGQPGDRLWVKETWRYISVNHRIEGAKFYDVQYFADWATLGYRKDWREFYGPKVAKESWEVSQCGIGDGKKRPSIYMPRWASRITLEITGIRVARVHDISEADAKAEGVEPYDVSTLTDDELQLLDAPLLERDQPYRNGFSLIWDSLNAKRGYGWSTNPHVWVIEFRRIEP